MPEQISLEGPVELIDGKLILQIPLVAGGDKLAPLARGIGETDGENLKVIIQPWLAEKLNIVAGSLVVVDNYNGKFTITRAQRTMILIENLTSSSSPHGEHHVIPFALPQEQVLPEEQFA